MVQQIILKNLDKPPHKKPGRGPALVLRQLWLFLGQRYRKNRYKDNNQPARKPFKR